MSDCLGVDLYEGDGNYDLGKLGAAGEPWVMAMIKVSQGITYNGGTWLSGKWKQASSCWGSRLGKSGFRVGYHYLDCAVDGALQGSYFLSQIVTAGGFGAGDPFVWMDLERGGQRRPFTKDQIVTCAKAFVDYVAKNSGKRVVCYGGEYLRDNKIVLAEIDCLYGSVADYDATLAPSTYQSIGCPLLDMMSWQYCGVESANNVQAHLKGYPWTTPSGPADISAITLNGGGTNALVALSSWC
jgi:GH25 family lysozyme M1 (1,4-beta-N-acetylmuramidase)